jgi:hypothetical protein
MAKTFGLHTAQFLTLFLAVALIIPIWATYKYDIYDEGGSGSPLSPFSGSDPRWASFIQTWNLSLGFLFAAYAYITKAVSEDKSQRDMYKWLVVLIAIVSWAFVIARPIGGSNVTDAGALDSPSNDQLDSVAKNVFGNLAAGSLFALPIVLIN